MTSEQPATFSTNGQRRIEAVQLEHRRRLVQSWQIHHGAKIFEIGCGQGDTTIALAEAVGPEGRIVATDPGPPEYGAPLTLGEATALIESSAIGPRVEFRLGFDLLAYADSFKDESFDFVALAHSSWYFESDELLQRTLQVARKLGRRLCFAEWSLEPRTIEQVPHLLAVLIQGQVQAFNPDSTANVRSPRSEAQTKNLIEAAGWKICLETLIPADEMQDADWEIAACLAATAYLETLDMPRELRTLIQSQLDTLRNLARPKGNTSLPCYSLVAE